MKENIFKTDDLFIFKQNHHLLTNDEIISGVKNLDKNQHLILKHLLDLNFYKNKPDELIILFDKACYVGNFSCVKNINEYNFSNNICNLFKYKNSMSSLIAAILMGHTNIIDYILFFYNNKINNDLSCLYEESVKTTILLKKEKILNNLIDLHYHYITESLKKWVISNENLPIISQKNLSTYINNIQLNKKLNKNTKLCIDDFFIAKI